LVSVLLIGFFFFGFFFLVEARSLSSLGLRRIRMLFVSFDEHRSRCCWVVGVGRFRLVRLISLLALIGWFVLAVFVSVRTCLAKKKTQKRIGH
jgi:hypothetical protein